MAHPSNSHPEASATSKSNLLDFFEEGMLVEWFSRNGKSILYGLIAFIALLVLVYRFAHAQTTKTEHIYIQAANDFNAFVKASSVDTNALASLERLESAIQSHSELHAAYDAVLAQSLLDKGMIPQALPLAKSSLARTHSNQSPFYAEYAATTLKIAQQQYQQALTEAIALQKNMAEKIQANQASQLSFGFELFALNLLRIALLYQNLGDKDAELRTWEEWKQYADLSNSSKKSFKNIDSEPFRFIIQKLAVGTLSLPDYIAHREKILKK